MLPKKEEKNKWLQDLKMVEMLYRHLTPKNLKLFFNWKYISELIYRLYNEDDGAAETVNS